MNNTPNNLQLKRLGIDTQQEMMVYLHKDCEVSRSEGFRALTRVEIHYKGEQLIASLNVLTSTLLGVKEASLSECAWRKLNVKEGDYILLKPLPPIKSFQFVKEKVYGKKLTPSKYQAIVEDIVAQKYSNIHITAFVTACASMNMSSEEIMSLTKAMITSGETIKWSTKIVADKHCIGGLPGNRTTPIVVSIAAAAGLTIPKTSSRSITSPAGTSDTMEVFTNVDLSLNELHQVIDKEKACLVWGGNLNLSPSDDTLIRVERALNLDAEGQMIASILSKKIAAGSTHVLIDIPVGQDAKVKNYEDAENLKLRFELIGTALGLILKIVFSKGNQPVGKGIGPALEAFDILKVLENSPDAPLDLKEKSLQLTADLLELTGNQEVGKGYAEAKQLLENGTAIKKFIAICKAQGRFTRPVLSDLHFKIEAPCSGVVKSINIQELAKIAKLSGAPVDKKAGVLLNKKLNDRVKKGEVLYTIYSESSGELSYTKDYVTFQKNAFIIE